MPLTLEQLEVEALRLPEESRAKLLERLLQSLQEASGMDDEVSRVWADEAERRDKSMDAGGEEGIPAEEVFKRLRT